MLYAQHPERAWVFPLVALRPKEEFWEMKVIFMASSDTDSWDTVSLTSQWDIRVYIRGREVTLLKDTCL